MSLTPPPRLDSLLLSLYVVHRHPITVDQLDIWLEVASTFMGNTPERLSNYPLSPFIFANLVLYSCCWACRINLQKFNAANSLRASSALGPVLVSRKVE